MKQTLRITDSKSMYHPFKRTDLQENQSYIVKKTTMCGCKSQPGGAWIGLWLSLWGLRADELQSQEGPVSCEAGMWFRSTPWRINVAPILESQARVQKEAWGRSSLPQPVEDSAPLWEMWLRACMSFWGQISWVRILPPSAISCV